MARCIYIATISFILANAVNCQYYGKKIDTFSTRQHNVKGKAYAADDTHVHIKNFYYDGQGPAAFFYGGTEGDGPTGGYDGEKIPVTADVNMPLTAYTDDSLTLEMPAGIKVSQLRWISVWCDEYSVNFGQISFASNLKVPKPQEIGTFTHVQPAHLVRSGKVMVMDAKTIKVNGFYYDGQGPDAYFIVGSGTDIGADGYYKLTDHNGRKLQKVNYNNEDVTLTLPEGVSVQDVSYLSLYCIQYAHDFSHVLFNGNNLKNLPPVLPIIEEEALFPNCETLRKGQFNVAWKINTSHIELQMMSTIGVNQYMSFGLSGKENQFSMIGADVIIARLDNNKMPLVMDYSLKDYALCSNGQGVCPDGIQDWMLLSGSVRNGIFMARVVRRLSTEDTDDKIYKESGAQQIVWALGGVNDQDQVTKHDIRIDANTAIEFGRTTEENNCKRLVVSTGPTVKWKETVIAGDEDNIEFNVVMGPTGGDRGYKAITGVQSWGIAFYINGYLIPHLYLKRGTTYTFKIETGNAPGLGNAEYHPFYITTDRTGGYVQLSQAKRDSQTVFKGIDGNGDPVQSAVGRFCEYQLTDFNAVQKSNTFDEFKKTLTMNCRGNSDEVGSFTFTPDESTPDNLFYNCFTHFNLGYKISVVNVLPIVGGAPSLTSSLATSTAIILVLLTRFL